MIMFDRKHLRLLSFVALLAAFLGQACGGGTATGPTVVQTKVVQTEEPAASEQTFQLALNPSKTELNLGEQIAVSAVPLGAEQVLPNLQWSLEPAYGYGTGSLSSDSGLSVVYYAPLTFSNSFQWDGQSPLASVIVTAKRADTEESNQVFFSVVGPPPSTISLLLQGNGGPLANGNAQGVLLAALPFQSLLDAAFPGQNVQLAVELPDQWSPAVSDVGYNYDWAKSQADQFFGGSEIQILVPDGDNQLVYLAELMANDHLEQVGIMVNVQVVPVADITAKMESLIASGLPVLMLTAQ